MTKTNAFGGLCALSLLLLSGMVSCKTTEANYRNAYEIAREKANSGVDSTIYTRIRNEARPSVVSVNGEELPLQTEYVLLTADGGGTAEMFKRYSIVVGQFKQIFNAHSMQSRMADNGYESFIVHTREPLYYVVASSHDTTQEALDALKKIKDDERITLRDPFPWVLESSRHITQ